MLGKNLIVSVLSCNGYVVDGCVEWKLLSFNASCWSSHVNLDPQLLWKKMLKLTKISLSWKMEKEVLCFCACVCMVGSVQGRLRSLRFIQLSWLVQKSGTCHFHGPISMKNKREKILRKRVLKG